MLRTCSFVAMFAVAAMASAQTAKPPVPAKKALHCPVMPDDTVDVAKATKEGLFADFKGRRYYFCCMGCKPAFKANPAKYAKGDSLPIPAKKPVKKPGKKP